MKGPDSHWISAKEYTVQGKEDLTHLTYQEHGTHEDSSHAGMERAQKTQILVLRLGDQTSKMLSYLTLISVPGK